MSVKVDQPIRSYVDDWTKQTISRLTNYLNMKSEAATIRYLIEVGLETLYKRDILLETIRELNQDEDR